MILPNVKVIAGLGLLVLLAVLFGLWQAQKAKTAKAEQVSVQTKLDVTTTANEVYNKASKANSTLGTAVVASSTEAQVKRAEVRTKITEVVKNEKEFFSTKLSNSTVDIYNAYLGGLHND